MSRMGVIARIYLPYGRRNQKKEQLKRQVLKVYKQLIRTLKQFHKDDKRARYGNHQQAVQTKDEGRKTNALPSSFVLRLWSATRSSFHTRFLYIMQKMAN
jgi:exonuclease III